MPRREQIDSPPSSPEVTPAAAGTASNGIDEKKNPTTAAPAIATPTWVPTSTSPTTTSTPNSREALLGRIARYDDQTLPVSASSGESTAGQDSTTPAAPSTTSGVLEQEMPLRRPVLLDIGLSFTETQTNEAIPSTSTAPTAREPDNQRRMIPSSTCSTTTDPFRPRRSERHHLAVAMDLLGDLFNDDFDEDDDFDDEDMDGFDIAAVGAHVQGVRASTDGVSDAPSQ